MFLPPVLDLPYYQDPFDSSNSGICRQVDQKSKSFKRYIKRRKITEVKEPPVFRAEVVQISACRDRQTAHEHKLDIGSDMAGALTTAFIHEVSISGPEGALVTYRDIMKGVHSRLRKHNLGQVPQFWTSHRFDLGHEFVL